MNQDNICDIITYGCNQICYDFFYYPYDFIKKVFLDIHLSFAFNDKSTSTNQMRETH
jgi:hypothetical protein